MTLLITGATGFVMSVLARHWLEAEPRARLVILDAAAGRGRRTLFRSGRRSSFDRRCRIT